MQERELQTLKEWLDILETIPLSYDRHLLLEQIVTLSYKYRHKNINMRQLAMCVSIIHYEEFDDLIIHIPIYINNRIYPPTTFPKLATLLTEAGRYKEAIAVCQKCIEWDLNDGTKSDYQGRIERIKKLERKSSLLPDEIIMDCDIHISCMRAELNERLEKIKSERKVPVLNAWYPDLSIKALDTSQYKFYKQWVKNWKQGKLIDIESQVGYIFLYIQSTLLKQISEDTIQELSRLNECYGADKPSDLRSLRYYCTAWASDCYVYLGQYKKAMIVFPNLYINHLISLP